MVRLSAVWCREQCFGLGRFSGKQHSAAGWFPCLYPILHKPLWMGIQEIPGGSKCWEGIENTYMAAGIFNLFTAADCNSNFSAGAIHKVFHVNTEHMVHL